MPMSESLDLEMVLCYEREKMLLRTRQWILERLGFGAEITMSASQFKEKPLNNDFSQSSLSVAV
jgi:hypothetical protein